MVLTVFFSSRISPFTSTVILRLRSPAATALVTSAMLRTWLVRLPAMKFTLSVRSFQVPATPFTSACPPSFPSVPTSRATRVTSAAKLESWSTMVLTVFFSSRISPFTSTVIFRDRSPLATAVVTAAMFRTWAVRFPAIPFTESVRSFQVPDTPSTRACPPSLPSVPTSRATRVTSLAKLRSWSTIVLMVFFSSRNSPLTSTVIFLDRSPLATAVVTSAMFRTCAVRFPAMLLTESVRSFHVPATPFTWAWPPSLPSVPTSRATRVTSLANDPSWSTIVLMVRAVRRNSPWSGRSSISRAIVLDRSPWATAPITRAVSMVGWTRSSIRSLTDSSFSRQNPVTSPSASRWDSFPSLPTTRLRRASSAVSRSFNSTTSLKASATLPATPVQSCGRRIPARPCLRAVRAERRADISLEAGTGSWTTDMGTSVGAAAPVRALWGVDKS